MQLKLEGHLSSEFELPELEYGKHSQDVGRTYWVGGFIWMIWTGRGWQRALAVRTAPQ